MEDSSNVEIPIEVTEHSNTVEVDVEQFLNEVFNKLAELRKSTIDKISVKKRFSAELDLVISQVGAFTELKAEMKTSAESYLQTLHSKWLDSLQTVMRSVHKKVEAIIEESTLQTSDFDFLQPIPKREIRASTGSGLYPTLDGLLDQLKDGGLAKKRKRSLAPSTSVSDSGRKIVRKSIGFQFKEMNKNQEEEEEDDDDDDEEEEVEETVPKYYFDEEPTRMSSQRRRSLTLEEKVQLIEAKEIDKMHVNTILKRFNCNKVQMYNILKNKEEIKREWSKRNECLKKATLKNNDSQLNQLVWGWFTKERLKKNSVTGSMIQAKAKQVAKNLGYTNFKASFAWLDSFKNDHHITLKLVGQCGNPTTLEAENVSEYLEEEEVEDVEEEEEEEEEEPVPEPPPVQRRGRKSTGRLSMAYPKATAVLSPPSKRTRKSMSAKPSNIKAKKKLENSPVVMLEKLSPRTLNSAFKFGQAPSEDISHSFWKPMLSLDTKDLLACPAVYRIKAHQAKKPSFIGVCDNLRSQIMKHKSGESTKQKHIDKFLERNHCNVSITFGYFDSLADAQRKCKEELNKFKEDFNKIPAFN